MFVLPLTDVSCVLPSPVGDASFYGSNALTDVYFSGTEEEWTAITINSGNDYLKNATIHYNYTGE